MKQPVEIAMPVLTSGMQTGRIARWLVAVGDSIVPSQIIAEVETDKSLMDLESPFGGIVSEILIPSGAADIGIGVAIARVDSTSDLQPHESTDSGPAVEPTEIGLGASQRSSNSSTPIAPVGSREAAASSPLARRLAARLGLNVDGIEGSGPNGRIVKTDVLKLAARRGTHPMSRLVPSKDFTQEKLSPMRRAIAARMIESQRSIPSFHVAFDCSVDALRELLHDLNLRRPHSARISLTAFFLRALALAIRDTPSVNIEIAGAALRRFACVDIALAIALPEGLVAPVIRDSANKPTEALNGEIRQLIDSARKRQLRSDQLTGGSFTLSNLGMGGIREFVGMVTPPQVGLLALGTIRASPLVHDGVLAVGHIVSCTLACDHRVIDGSHAAVVSRLFRSYIETPDRLLG